MKNINNKNSLVELLDTVFAVSGEMIKDNGEDSYAFFVNDKYGMIAVFDGCGGIGSRRYALYDDKTGAYIASHTVAQVAKKWFEGFSETDKDLTANTADEICHDLQNVIDAALKSVERETPMTMITGSLVKSFPTTASMILFKREENKISAMFIWAGDSRGFILTPCGLTQVTKDDIEENDDALSNLKNDGRLINVISASGDYHLNKQRILCNEPMLLITATDGFFGYFKTPMEFEYMLLRTLSESNSVDEWKKKIKAYILRYTGDDYTLCVAGFGFKNFKTMKKALAERVHPFYDEYIAGIDDANDDELVRLWNKYKETYYRGV